MSVFGTLQRSMGRPRILTFLHLFPVAGPLQLASSKHKNRPGDSKPAALEQYRMDRLFIDALVQACSCREHARLPTTQPSTSMPPYMYHKARRRYAQQKSLQVRSVHTSQSYTYPPAAATIITRDEYKQLLDYYVEPLREKPGSEDSGPLALSLPPLDTDCYNKVNLGGYVTPVESTTLKESSPPALEASNHQEEHAIERLLRVLENEENSQEVVLQTYSALPFPGVSYLSDEMRRLLFRRISVVERKTNETMMQYLSVVDDMKAAKLPLTEAEWNSAISFAGRCFAKVTATEVELALRCWKEMEQEAEVKSGNVTFNILFDIATKAGKFVLAEMILKEMQVRGLSINRFTRAGLIYYHGLRGDGDGVRKAYLGLVEAGEIVDTVVMNCVITSLIRAGEPSAADQVYQRMKAIFSSKTGTPVPNLNWKEVRGLGRVLDRAARNLRLHPERRQRLQDETCLAPNLHTYAIFVEHHVADTGELRRITALLEEMQILGVPMHGRIFVKLFKGFASHGGVRYTSWTRQRLESVWTSLLAVLDERASYVVVQKWMVVWVIRAFSKCCGAQRTLEVWEELGTRWKASGLDEEQAVFYILREILKADPGLKSRQNAL